MTPWRRYESKGLRWQSTTLALATRAFVILQLKPDVIKLDGSLIRGIDRNGDCRALASALIRFGHETGSKIVAECVETEAELEILRELQVGKAQGYLLGRPLSFAATG